MRKLSWPIYPDSVLCSWNTAFVLRNIDVPSRVFMLSKLIAAQACLNNGQTHCLGQIYRRDGEARLPLLGVEGTSVVALADCLAHKTLRYTIDNMSAVVWATCKPWQWFMRGVVALVFGN